MFRLHTAPGVSGLFGQTFWTQHMLRAAGAYPVIWHATLALAAIERWKVSEEAGGSSDYVFALQHYHHAIQRLMPIAAQEDYTYQDKETVLAAEILFVGINLLAGYLEEATVHAANSIRLYTHWGFGKPSRRLVDGIAEDYYPTPTAAILQRQAIVTIVTSIKIQFTNRIKADTIRAQQEASGATPYLAVPSSRLFRDIGEAYDAMTMVVSDFFLTVRSTGRNKLAAFDAHKNLILWTDKFERFSQVHKMPPQEKWRERFRWRILEAYVQILRATAPVKLAGRPSGALVRSLEGLEDLANEWHARFPSRDGMHKQHADFSFSMSMLETCHCVALVMSDYAFRKRCLDLIRRWDVSHGLWDTMLMAAVLEATMEVEDEGGIGNMHAEEPQCECIYREVICKEHKICRKVIQGTGARRALFRYTTFGDAENNLPMKEKLLRY